MAKNIPASRLSGGTSILVGAADAPDSDQEKKELANEIARATLQHDAQMAALGLQETQAYLADAVSARDNQYRVQESEYTSWLAKNAQPLLAFCITGSAFILFTVVIVGGSKGWFSETQNKDIVIYILGALTTVATQVVSYYFGSSSGSKDKSNALNSIAKGKS